MVNSELSKDMEIVALRALLAEAVHDIGRLVNCKNPVDCGDIITEKSFDIPHMNGKMIIGNEWYLKDKALALLNERKIEL